jgi:Uma2 family endonuclease
MVAATRLPRYSPAEYIARERVAESRSEYWDGEIVAMAGGSRSHNRIVRNLTRWLGNELGDGPCEHFASDTRVRVPECNTYYYPDLVIVCGDADYEDAEAETLLNPTVIFEVLSPATEAFDRGHKFDCYRSLSSLTHYILVEQSKPGVYLYTRQSDDVWLLSPLHGADATLTIEAAGIALPFARIYERVDFARQPPR